MDEEQIAVELARLDLQVKRLMSDAESEKGTRNRMNEATLKKLDELERKVHGIQIRIALAAGGLTAIIFLANFLFRGHP